MRKLHHIEPESLNALLARFERYGAENTRRENPKKDIWRNIQLIANKKKGYILRGLLLSSHIILCNIFRIYFRNIFRKIHLKNRSKR